MSKHTPAPWFLYIGRHDTGTSYHITNKKCTDSFSTANAKRIASCHNESDARLVAAAPELLEALEAVREHVHLFGESDLTDKVNAALAKAKGE